MLANTAVMQFHAVSAKRLSSEPLPERCAILRMADSEDLLEPWPKLHAAVANLDLVFADADESYGAVRAPDDEHGAAILRFYEEAKERGAESFVAQCQAGVGRSVAACGALSLLDDGDFRLSPAYNRRLFRAILAAAGRSPPHEPLVSIAVRVKYHPDRLLGFLLSLRAQRYDHWECVAFTDGPNEDARRVVSGLGDARVRLIETPAAKGRWGHPYRQMAIDACRGEWIGTQNDDNYLTPGYIEQLMVGAEMAGAELAVCGCLHRYSGWSPVDPGGDLCTWLARRDLISRVRWEADGFYADRDFLKRLCLLAGEKVAVVGRPLVVKN